MVYLDKNSFEIRKLLESAAAEIRQPKLEPTERQVLAQKMRGLVQSMIDFQSDEDKLL
jgi:hypothetical protein